MTKHSYIWAFGGHFYSNHHPWYDTEAAARSSKQHGYLGKTWKWHANMARKKMSQSLTPQWRNMAINDCWERKSQSSLETRPLIGPSPSGQPWTHVHLRNTKWAQRLYLYSYLLLCVCIVIRIKENEAWDAAVEGREGGEMTRIQNTHEIQNHSITVDWHTCRSRPKPHSAKS